MTPGESMLPADADPNPTLPPPAADDLHGRPPKKDEHFRVYNHSKENFLSLEVAIFDTTAEPLKRLFDFLIHGSETGLWLKPYRGIPASQGARFFDLVYLDEENRVAWEVDHYPNPQYTVLEEDPASALLLPAHTIFASQLRPGDQLAISGLGELVGILETLSTVAGAGTETRATEEQTQAAGTESFPLNSGSQLVPPQAEWAPPAKDTSLAGRIRRWFSFDSENNDRSNRKSLPGLVAYHWSGGTPQPYQLGNISESGFYLLTDERPYPGTLMLMTLQRTGNRGERLGNSIAVFSKVIRWGPDGVGFAFVPLETKDPKNPGRQSTTGADKESLDRFLKEFNLPKRK
jgi:hypothetical protein